MKPQQIPNRLRLYREKAGLRQIDIAHMLGQVSGNECRHPTRNHRRYTGVVNTPGSNNLRRFREKAGLRQIDVARALGISNSDRISHWERGSMLPSLANLFKLAALFGVLPHELYPEFFESFRRGEYGDAGVFL